MCSCCRFFSLIETILSSIFLKVETTFDSDRTGKYFHLYFPAEEIFAHPPPHKKKSFSLTVVSFRSLPRKKQEQNSEFLKACWGLILCFGVKIVIFLVIFLESLLSATGRHVWFNLHWESTKGLSFSSHFMALDFSMDQKLREERSFHVFFVFMLLPHGKSGL